MWVVEWVEREGVTNWHFSRSFHFYFTALTLVIIVQVLFKRELTFFNDPFRLLTLLQTIKKIKKRVYSNP